MPASPTICRSLCYHEFSTSSSRDVYTLSPAAFNLQLRTLMRLPRPPQFTFDDGHISQLSHAASCLESVGQRGTFFVPAQWVNTRSDCITWGGLQRLHAAGHSIGAHGLTHCLLTACSPGQLSSELSRSRQILEHNLGFRVRSMSAPGGRWNARVLAACRAAGYEELYISAPVLTSRMCELAGQLDIRLIPRLAVRRRMRIHTLVQYSSADRLTIKRIATEYKLRELLKNLLGDKHYAALWRYAFRTARTGPSA